MQIYSAHITDSIFVSVDVTILLQRPSLAVLFALESIPYLRIQVSEWFRFCAELISWNRHRETKSRDLFRTIVFQLSLALPFSSLYRTVARRIWRLQNHRFWNQHMLSRSLPFCRASSAHTEAKIVETAIPYNPFGIRNVLLWAGMSCRHFGFQDDHLQATILSVLPVEAGLVIGS